jgi:general secretion pathway protein I
MIQERQRQILYSPCSIEKNRPLGAPAASHFRRHRPSGMGNHSRTGSSSKSPLRFAYLNLGYIRHLTDSGASPQKGFTLLEIMIAVAIIAIALTTLLGSQSQSVYFANSVKFETMATLLAQSKMSELVREDSFSLSSNNGDFGDDFPGYTWEATVGDIVIEGIDVSDYLKQIDLTVAWGVHRYDLRLYHYVAEEE